MERPVTRWLLLVVLLALGCVSAQQKAAPSPSDASPTAGQQSGAAGSYFRSQNQKDRKTTASDSVTTPAPLLGGVSYYRQQARDHSICTIIRTDALLTFTFKDKIHQMTEKDIYLHDDITISGHCHLEDSSLLTMRWGSYGMNWFFSKTPGGERWFLERMELSFNTSEKIFESYPRPGKVIKLVTNKETMYFPTPVGKAYQCDEETEIKLEGSKDISASVLLRELKLQPFIFKNDEFGPEFICSPGAKSYRDERAPLAVGTTLAVVTLLTVAGYGVYRYVKIKKVQYDNVE